MKISSIEGIVSIVFLAILFLISVLEPLGVLDSQKWIQIPNLILILLVSFTSYWIVNKNKEYKKLTEIENMIYSLGGVKVFSRSDKGLEYLANCFLEAKFSIEQAALAPSISGNVYTKYDQIIERVLKKGSVKYKHITVLDPIRWKRVNDFLSNQNIKNYFVSYYDKSHSSLMGISYAIIDEKEVVMRYPYSPEQSEFWLSIKQPDIVKLFGSYFRKVWQEGTKIDKSDITRINELESKYGTSNN